MSKVKFVMLSNYLNHHQIPFCDKMYELLNGSFVFIQTEEVEEERIRMGWQEELQKPYLLYYQKEPARCAELVDGCEVFLFGGTDEESYVEKRLRDGKKVIRYSERIYKEGQWKAISPRGLYHKYKDHTRYRNREVYLLCAGAYVPSDFAIVKAYPGKMLKWGYFPEVKQYANDFLQKKGYGEEKKTYLLWAARMIDWKHPELAVETAKYLREKGYDFHMDLIGGGVLETSVREQIAQEHLEDVVTLLGYRSPTEVRRLMEKADIYLATSDRKEGWGAVINEAMNSGCGVVASHKMGAAPYLLQQGKNGFLFQDGNKKDLFEKTEQFVRDKELRRLCAGQAMETIQKLWNGSNAAKNLVGFCLRKGFLTREDVLNEEELLMQQPLDGPCSEAEVIPERKMYRRILKESNWK